MTDRLASIERLRRLADRLSTGGPDEQWLAEALTRYLGQAAGGEGLDKILGLAPRQSERAWWTEAARRSRDDLIREMARFYPGKVGAKAEAIARLGRLYAGTAWPSDRRAETMPARYRGTVRALLFEAFKTSERFPTSARQIRNILERRDGPAHEISTVVSFHDQAGTDTSDQEDLMSRYSEKIEQLCADAGGPELAEPLIRRGYGEQMIAGLIRSGEADRLLQQSGAEPSDAPEPSSKAAEQTDHGWARAIATANAEAGF